MLPTVPSIAPSRGVGSMSMLTQETMKETKDGVFVGTVSPLHQCVDDIYTDGGTHTSGLRTLRPPRVAHFLNAVEIAVANYGKLNSTQDKQKWINHEFRALCEAAGPIAGELSSRAMLNSGLDCAPVSESTFIEHLACHVSKATKEKVQKLAMVGRMAAAPSQRASRGTPASTPLSKASLMAAVGATSVAELFPSAPADATTSSDALPSTVAAPCDLKKRTASEAKLALPKGRPQPSGEGSRAGRAGSPQPPDNRPERPLNMEKQMVIMPWTIPPPFNFGVLLRRVTPKNFRHNASKASSSSSETVVPTVDDIVKAAGTDQVYALWMRREEALRATATSPAIAAASNNDNGSGAAASASLGPIFPHTSAQGAGLKQPSGIGSAATAESGGSSSRHVGLRKPLLTAIAHYGVHAVHYS